MGVYRKIKRLLTDPTFQQLTRKQAMDKYYRDKQLGKEPRKKLSQQDTRSTKAKKGVQKNATK